MAIPCNIITSEIKELAKSLNSTSNRVVNLVTCWQMNQQGDDVGRYPTKEELQSFMEGQKAHLEEIYVSLPTFKQVENTDKLVEYKDGQFIIPKGINPIEFGSYIANSSNSDKILSLADSNVRASAFILFKEMALRQHGLDRKDASQDKKAEDIAIAKLEAWIEFQNKKKNQQVQKKEDLSDAKQVQYTPKGKDRMTYYIKGSRIFNSKGIEVFKEDSVDRNKIFSNLAVQEGRAVIIQHNGNKYVVNKKGQIISVTTGKIMQWGEENGDRKSIITLAESKFSAQKGYDVFLSTQNNIKMNNSPSSINIYAGTGENAHLSNFADRPIEAVSIEDIQIPFKKEVDSGTYDNILAESIKVDTFYSVEQAFQYAKTFLALLDIQNAVEESTRRERGATKEEVENTKNKLNNIRSIQTKIVNTTSGGALRSLGRSVPLSKESIALWDKYKAETLKGLIKESFLQNEDAAKQLLTTRDIPLTHNQDRGEYRTLFPKLLMEVREELREVFPQHDPLAVDAAYGNRDLFSDSSNDKLQITPTRSIDNKAKDKGSISNKFIGFGEEGSSTNAYRVQAGDKANTGDYNSQDTIFVSVPGKRGDAKTRKEYQDKTIKEAIKAIEAGATLITDNIDYINNSDYNEGEKRLYQNLEHKGYHYETITVGNSKVGKWTKQSTQKKEVWPKNDPLSKATEEKILEYHGYFEGGGATLNTVPTDLMNDVAGYFMGSSPLSEERAQEFLQYVSMDPNQYALYSGDVIGSDNYWGLVAQEYGIENVTNYRPEDITDENREDATKEVIKANKFLGRVFPMLPREATEHIKERTQEQADYQNRVILRDALQASSADAIFAIGKIKGKPTSDGIIYKSQVEGGTGWAVQIGINQGKPVYVFDQVRNQWYKNEGTTENRKFIPMQEAPKLTTRFAGIGTRNINDNGRQAIKDAFIQTFGYSKDISFRDPNSLFTDEDFEGMDNGEMVPAKSYVNQEQSEESDNFDYNQLVRPNISTQDILQTVEDETYQAYMTFTPQTIKDRTSMLYQMFEDVLSEVMDETIKQLEEQLEQATSEKDSYLITEKTDKLEDPESGYQYLMSIVPFSSISEKVKERVQEEKQDADSERDSLEYQKVLDNFDYLMNNACRLIERHLNIRIVTKKIKNANGETVLSGRILENTQDQEYQDTENNEDTEGKASASNLGWSTEIKMLNPFTAASRITKRIISNIPEEGSNAWDDLGWTRHMNPELVHTILLDNLSTMVNVDSWYNPKGETVKQRFPALAKLAVQYPWVINIMNTIDGNNQAISVLFSDFYKTYSKQGKIVDGKLITLNDHSIVSSMIDTVSDLYDSRRQVNGKNTLWDKEGKYRQEVVQSIQEQLATLQINGVVQDKEDRSSKAKDIKNILKSIGITVKQEVINRMLNSEEDISKIITTLSNVSTLVDSIAKNKGKEQQHLITQYKSVYSNIAQNIGEVAALKYRVTFREGGKDYPNYVAPCEIDIMIKELTNPNREQRLQYIKENFQDSGYLYNPNTEEYNNKILDDVVNSPSVRQNLEVMTVRHMATMDSNSAPYNEWTPGDLIELFLSSYFTQDNPKAEKHYSFYPFPIFSDSEAMMLIKLPSYRTTRASSYKQKLMPLLRKVVEQELYRINLVQQRRKNPDTLKIINFDKNGDKFFFFPQLNDYTVIAPLQDGTIARIPFLNRINQLKNDKNATYDDIENLIDKAINDIMTQEFNDFIADYDIDWVSAARSHVFNRLSQNQEKAKAVFDQFSLSDIRQDLAYDALQEFFWNYYYAQSQVVQLTVTDPAFYKFDNGVDFQKRFKQLFASGNRLNTKSKKGRDMSYNIVISDKYIASRSYTEIGNALQKMVDSKWISQEYKDSLMEGYLQINTADGQGIRSFSSFKSFLDMAGLLTTSLEESLDRLQQGTPQKKDFLRVLQVIKPFAYGSLLQDDGVGGKMRVGHQFKNSEAPLLQGLSIVAKSVMGESTFLNALHEFMEAHQLDTAQFESCVKTGGQGIIDLHFSDKKLQRYIQNKPKQWEQITKAYSNKYGNTNAEAREIWEKGNIELLKSKAITQEEFNDRTHSMEPSKQEMLDALTKSIIADQYDANIDRNDPRYEQRFKSGTVIKMPYKNYMIAQPTPEHLFDAYSKIGSQISNFITADLPEDFTIKIGNTTFNKEQFKLLYDSIFIANRAEAYLDVQDKFKDPIALSEMLLSKIQGNPKYGRQFEDALKLVDDPNNPGKKIFNIGFDFPSLRSQIEELMLSTFKNKVTVQEILGGNAILTSSFSFSNKLKATFKEDGGIECAQCYLPAHSRKFYEPFMDENGIIDMKNVPKELREMISYRIPTEGKYSALPLQVIGFLPPIYGSTIMLPVDISFIAGEDYDVDKRFLMIPAFRMINKYNYAKAEQDFLSENPERMQMIKGERKKAFEEFLQDYKKAQESDSSLSDISDDHKSFKEWLYKQDTKRLEWSQEVADEWQKWFKDNKHKYITGKKAIKIKPKLSNLPSTNPTEQDILEVMANSTRQERDNLLIDLMFGVLTHPQIAAQVLNSGNYEQLKRASKTGTILSDSNIREGVLQENGLTTEQLYSYLQGLSNKELSDYVAKYESTRSILNPSTYIYNHQQNMTSGKLIGNYANNTTSQTKFQDTGIAIQPWYQITINGRKISSVSEMLTGQLPDNTRQLISKNCSETSAASVDDVKDPNLKNLMQNPKTAKVLGGALRAGMTFEEAGLIFKLPEVVSIIEDRGELSSRSIDKAVVRAYKKWKDIEDGNINNIRKWYYEQYRNVSISTQDLVDCVLQQSSKETKFKVLLAVSNIVAFSNDLSGLTMQSRQDSPNGSISHTLSGALKQIISIDSVHQQSYLPGYSLTGVREGFIKNNVLESIEANKNNKRLLTQMFMDLSMRRQQSAYTLGIELPYSLVSSYFASGNRHLTDMLKEFAIHNKYLSESTIEDIKKGFLQYMASKTELFGDSESGSQLYKKNYYVKQFPDKAMSIIENTPELLNNPTVASLYVNDEGVIQLRHSGRNTEAQKQEHTSNLDALLKSEDPNVQAFAIDLFMHSFYTDGLNFGPNSYGNFFSINYVNQFKEIQDFYRNLKDSVTEADVMKFKDQLMANSYYFSSIAPTVNVNADNIMEDNDNYRVSYLVEAKNIKTRNAEGEVVYPQYVDLIVFEDDNVYYQPAMIDLNNSSREFIAYTTYDTFPFDFNANKDVHQIMNNADTKAINKELAEEANSLKEKELQNQQYEQEVQRYEPDLSGKEYSEEEGQQVLKNNGEQPLC